jgi:hypothetical protein
MNYVTRKEFQNAMLALYKEFHERTKNKRYSNERKDANTKATIPPITKLDSESSVEARKPEAEKKADSKYHFWSLFVQWGTLIAVVIYATIAALQWHEFQKANKISFASLEAQTRPWIGIVGSVDIGNDPQYTSSLKMKLMNYGSSAGIVATPVFGYTFGGRNGRWFDQHKICEQAEHPLHERDSAKTVDTVFPGKDGALDKSVPTKEFIAGSLQESKLVLVGCIAYMSQTGAIYYTRVGYFPVRGQPTPNQKTLFAPVVGWTNFYTDTKNKQ